MTWHMDQTTPCPPCHSRPGHAKPCQVPPSRVLCQGGLQLPLWLRPDPDVGLQCHPGHAPGQGTLGVTWPWGCPPSLQGGLAAAAAPCRDLRAGVTGIMTGSRRGAGEEPVLNNVQIGHDICAVSWGRGDPPPPPRSVTKRWRLFGGDSFPRVSHSGSPPGRDVGPVAEGQPCCVTYSLWGIRGGLAHPTRAVTHRGGRQDTRDLRLTPDTGNVVGACPDTCVLAGGHREA